MNILKKTGEIIVLLILTALTLATSLLIYVYYLYPDADYEQMLNTLDEINLHIINLIVDVSLVLKASFLVLIIPALCYIYLSIKKQLLLSFCMFCFILYYSGWLQHTIAINTTSTLYEEEYVSPKNIAYEFPKNKRNLLLIYLESFENNFQNPEYYGENLIPNLSALQTEGQYSDTFHIAYGTGYSIAAIVSSECAIPLRYLPTSDIYSLKYFLPQATCFPEILKQNGYQTTIIKAADITFTRANIFAKDHQYTEAMGTFEIKDKYKDIIPIEDGAFDGVSDKTLFEAAKQKLNEFDKTKPFMLTLFSLDTHSPYHEEKTCPKKYNNIKDAYLCTDKTVADFISWFKTTPHYKNTTIVILGDHLLPTKELSPKIAKRKIKQGIFNVFLNLPQGLKIDTHKKFNTFDIAPTILEALNIKLSDHAFGLGRSLFSDKKSLGEKLTLSAFNRRLRQSSPIYNDFSTPLTKRVDTYLPIELNKTYTNSEIIQYSDAYETILDTNYLDRLNIKLPETLDKDITITIQFSAMLNNVTKIRASVNNNEQTFILNGKKPPYEIKFNLTPKDIKDNQLQIKFKNSIGYVAATQMGIAPTSFTITKK